MTESGTDEPEISPVPLPGSDWQNDDDLVFAEANGRPFDKNSDYDDWCGLLGHAQTRRTMDIYSHVMPALAREAADRMGAVVLSPPATNGNQDCRARAKCL